MIMWHEIQRRVISSLNLMFEPEQIKPVRKAHGISKIAWPLRINLDSNVLQYVEIGGGPTGLILTTSTYHGKIRQLLFKHPDTQIKDMFKELNKVIEYGNQTRKTS